MNKTKISINISYSITASEIAKIKEVTGLSDFYLIPILNNVSTATYKDIDSGEDKSLKDMFTSIGSSFDSDALDIITPTTTPTNYAWTNSLVSSGVNNVSWKQKDYGSLLKSETDVTLGTSIKFGVSESTSTSSTFVTTIDFSELVNVSCTFTEE